MKTRKFFMLSETLRTHGKSMNPFFAVIAACSITFFAGCKKDFNEVKSLAATDFSDAGTRSKTNILILLSDDVGYEVPTCDGGTSYSTPNIDMLAQGGKRFTQCHATPKCTPSRVMLLTGKYNFRNYTDFGILDTTNKTFANMFANAGYATCYTGKWQLDGGDVAIRKFGFQRYSVWQPYNINAEDEGNRYKGATIYQDGDYLPQDVTSNKYSEDEFTAYTLNFIDSVTAIKKPFFAFYSLINCHSPFQPTPDDLDYATWDTLRNEPKYFPSMVKYHDKKIGEIIHHLDSAGLLENTMIFYFGDNGTNTLIRSQFQGYTVKGGKGNTDEPGTNVPLIVYQRGKIPAQTTSDVLIDFSDFFPTFQKIAGIRTLSADYGIMDGVSFAPAILSDIDTIRTSIYDSYSTHPDRHSFIKWAQNYEYKLYDKDAGTQANQFIKLGKCMPDGTPIPDSLMTPEQIQVKRNLQKVLKKYDAQMN